MTVVTLGAKAAPEDIMAVLDLDGCVILDRLASPELMGPAATALADLLEQSPPGAGAFCGSRTRRVASLIRRMPAIHHLVTNSTVLAVMAEIFGGHCDRFQLNVTQAIRIEPGEMAQALHRDDDLYPFHHDGYEVMVNCMWALTPFTAVNGGTCLVPGSHRWPVERPVHPDEIVAGEMAAGSVLIYYGSTYHGGGANTSSAPRDGLVIGYALGWVRQMENQYLAVPPEEARRLPEALQRLIGYQAHRPNLGWYECRDPIAILRDDAAAMAGAEDMFPVGHYERLQQNRAPEEVE